MAKREELFAIYRVIDANLNRLKEGIRVVEDIYRYIYNNKDISLKLKHIRHLFKATNIEYKNYLQQRDIIGDPLKQSIKSEKERKDKFSIIISNYKRAQESARVLEEIFKLIDKDRSELFKNIRYQLYDLEKQTL